MIIGTRLEFENLADMMLRDYLGYEYEGHSPLDIALFAKEYLKLEISYFAFKPEDNIEGMRTGNQIILDRLLEDPARVGERNFTIAHECGHDLINMQDPSYMPQHTINYRTKGRNKPLKTEADFQEWQANVVASCLLLRPPLVAWALYTFTRKEKLSVYGGDVFYKVDRYAIRMMAKFLGVSQTCLRYRLDRLGYLDHKPYMDYDPIMDIYIPWEVNR